MDPYDLAIELDDLAQQTAQLTERIEALLAEARVLAELNRRALKNLKEMSECKTK